MFIDLDIQEINRGLSIIRAAVDKAQQRAQPGKILVGEFIAKYDLSKRLINTFKLNRINKDISLEEFINTYKEEDIKRMRGLGAHQYRELEELLSELGYFIKY